MTPSIEERLARLEGGYEQISLRLSRLEAEVAALRADINSRFMWLIGILLGTLIPMWVTIILAILLK